MIVRKLAIAIRKQNWSTVLIEFILVVAGVLLALQFDTWNQERKDRALERQYLERLYDDMLGSIEDHEPNARWDKERVESQALVLNALRAKYLSDKDKSQFDQGLTYIGIHNPIRLRWGTVDELKATGNIALITDINLRNQISQVEASHTRGNRIVSAQQAILGILRPQIAGRYRPLTYNFQSGVPVTVEYDFESLAADDEFINLVANAQLSSTAIYLFIEGRMKEIENLRDRLHNMLAKTSP